MKTPQPQPPPCRKDWLWGLLLLAAILLAYQPVWHAGFIWDDDGHLTGPALRSWTGLAHIWIKLGATQQYYPLVHTVFWIEHHLWGEAPLGYHLLNVLLHFFSALLLVRILRHLELPGAWLAAALFALHPIQVESVAWITELKNTLSGLCCLASALAYLRFDRDRQRLFYGLSLGLFAAGLFAKTVIATMPAALLLLFWWRRKKLRWKEDAAPLAPFFIAGIGMGLLTAWVERTQIILTQASASHLSFMECGLVPGRALWFYLEKLVWPHPLIFIYPRWEVSGTVWWQFLFPAAALWLAAALWRWRRRVGAGPLVALLFFAGTLFPALGFFDVYPFRYSFVADHYQYLACIGPLALAAAGLERGLAWLTKQSPWLRAVFCAALLAALGALTRQQCEMYAGLETLWRATIARNPGCWLAHNNLGAICVQKGEVAQGVAQFRQALQLKPGEAEAHFNLAMALAINGDADEAIAQYRQALEIKAAYADARYNLGLVLARQGEVGEAIAQYRQALAIKPAFPEAHYDLGLALARSGKLDEAIAQYRAALQFKPDYVEALNNLGIALIQKEDLAEAIAQFRQAVAIQPGQAQAHYNLGTALAMQGETGEAVAQFQQAVTIQPDYAEARFNLGVALASMGQTDQAIAQFRRALQIKPDYEEARRRLAALTSGPTGRP
jgi:tetratricopeptide (TPR) repeat protein